MFRSFNRVCRHILNGPHRALHTMPPRMQARTPLYESHILAGARMVDFGGWDMPLNYGSQTEEHHAVRRHAGMFDVSHMTVLDMEGPNTTPFLRYLLANDVVKLKTNGKALYSCMLNTEGGVVDDLIGYRMSADQYRLVTNASTRDKDLEWISSQATQLCPEGLRITERLDLASIAVQGPKAREIVAETLAPFYKDVVLGIKPFSSMMLHDMHIARTGYTGEDGFEIIMPAVHAPAAWSELLDAGVSPCGLAARDTLRLEAGMNLYGNDMDDTIAPQYAGLGWTVDLRDSDRDFIGREAVENVVNDPVRFVGLVLTGKGVLRTGQKIEEGGVITSGGYSPTLGKSIAMARLESVPMGMPADGDDVHIHMRGKPVTARVVPLPFVRHGKVSAPLDDI